MLATLQTLDHVAVVSDRPDALFEAYGQLGFQLTPLARHAGAIRPGEDPVPWGIGNRCAMFRGGYLELLAVLDGDLYCRGFPERLDRYEGLHIVAFECADADATAAELRDRGVALDGVGRLERRIDTPDGDGLARFSLVRLRPEETPECHLNILRHHTPELLWQQRYLDHPNGAESLLGTTLCVEDPAAIAGRYARFLGVAPAADGSRHRFELPRGRFDIVAPDDLRADTGQTAPVLPFVANMTLGSGDLSRTRDWLLGQGVAFDEQGGRLLTDPADGLGAMCIFE